VGVEKKNQPFPSSGVAKENTGMHADRGLKVEKRGKYCQNTRGAVTSGRISKKAWGFVLRW